MSTISLEEVLFVWGSPADLSLNSDGLGEFASTYKLTKRGIAKLAVAFGFSEFRYAEFCGCPNPVEGDGVHAAGEPSDLICLASPLSDTESSDQ